MRFVALLLCLSYLVLAVLFAVRRKNAGWLRWGFAGVSLAGAVWWGFFLEVIAR